MPAAADEAWAGIDVGKGHHWVCVVGEDGRQLLSVEVVNDEAGIGAVIGSVTGLAGKVAWPSTSSGCHRPCCWPS